MSGQTPNVSSNQITSAMLTIPNSNPQSTNSSSKPSTVGSTNAVMGLLNLTKDVLTDIIPNKISDKPDGKINNNKVDPFIVDTENDSLSLVVAKTILAGNTLNKFLIDKGDETQVAAPLLGYLTALQEKAINYEMECRVKALQEVRSEEEAIKMKELEAQTNKSEKVKELELLLPPLTLGIPLPPPPVEIQNAVNEQKNIIPITTTNVEPASVQQLPANSNTTPEITALNKQINDIALLRKEIDAKVLDLVKTPLTVELLTTAVDDFASKYTKIAEAIKANEAWVKLTYKTLTGQIASVNKLINATTMYDSLKKVDATIAAKFAPFYETMENTTKLKETIKDVYNKAVKELHETAKDIAWLETGIANKGVLTLRPADGKLYGYAKGSDKAKSDFNSTSLIV